MRTALLLVVAALLLVACAEAPAEPTRAAPGEAALDGGTPGIGGGVAADTTGRGATLGIGGN